MEIRLLDAEEVAELTGLKKTRVYELSRKKLIPFVQIGERQYRYSMRHIEEWIENGGNQGLRDKENNG